MTQKRLEQRLLDLIQDAFHRTGNWLSSALALFPLFILTSSLGLGYRLVAKPDLNPNPYLWLSGFVILLGLISSRMGDFGPTGWSSFGPIPGIWIHLSVTILMLVSLIPIVDYSMGVVPSDSLIGTVVIGSAVCIIGFIVGIMTEQIAGMKVGGILAVGLACITLMITIQKIVVQIIKLLLAPPLISDIGGIIILVVVILGTLLFLGIALIAMRSLEKVLTLNKPSWKLRLSLGILFLAYIVVLWYCYGYGWQVLS